MGPSGPGSHAPDHLTSISVVTIAWRNERYAAEFAGSLVRAVERAEGDPPQLVVVVNGPDGEAAATALSSAWTGTSPAPIMVRSDHNTGFSGGANLGVARTTADIVVIANLDLTFDETFIEVLRRQAGHTWDLLAPRVLQGDPARDNGVSARTRSHRLAWVTPPPSVPGPVPAGNGSCMILRRSTVERRTLSVGAVFDPEYRSFNEDIDLFWWADDARLLVRYVPELTVHHALAGSFGGRHRFVDRPDDIQRQVIANYRVTVWKNARRPMDWLGLLLGEAIYLGQAVAARRLNGVSVYAASWAESFRTAGAIRRRRGRLRPSPRSRE